MSSAMESPSSPRGRLMSSASWLVGAGTVFVVLSATLPWVVAARDVTGFGVGPLDTPFRGASILVLVIGAVGLMAWFTDSLLFLLAGVAANCWLWVALPVWSAGATVVRWLPTSVVSNEAVAVSAAGSGCAVCGAVLVLAGCVLRLAEISFASRRMVPVASGVLAAAGGLVVLVALSRQVVWFSVNRSEVAWDFGPDVVFGVGSILAIVQVVLVGALVWVALSRSAGSRLLLVVAGSAVLAIGLFSWFAFSVIEWGFDVVRNRVSALEHIDGSMSRGSGSLVTAFTGAASVLP